MEISERQREVMLANGHLLVVGGPGSGKTTISILKAGQFADRNLRLSQKVLFLSFARATISRVIEAIDSEKKIPREHKRRIDVETYHSFFWRLLKAHGYLVGLPRKLTLLAPPDEAVALSGIRAATPSKATEEQKTERDNRLRTEQVRLAHEEGLVCFDLFAEYVGDILSRSQRIRRLVHTMYPVIILDEFQDTNREQWRIVKALGEFSTLVALADPEQRIYDFIGADPERLDHFKEAFHPVEVDLSSDNYRSAGTDITKFANDILSGDFRQAEYVGIDFATYEANEGQAMVSLVTNTYAARKRLINAGIVNWSLAILVPTKKMTRLVSDNFRSPPANMAAIRHSAIVEMEAAILGAEIVAFLMQPSSDENRSFERLIYLLRNYFHGKGGASPTSKDIKEAAGIIKAYEDMRQRELTGQQMKKRSVIGPLKSTYNAARAVVLTGNPDNDWKAIRSILEEGECVRLAALAKEVRNVRLLERGTQLRQLLSQDWRDNGTYTNALAITQQAFVKEHFATNSKRESGVVVMNMHKSKGKQFDEVIIFEGWPRIHRRKIVANPDRIVWNNLRENVNDQSRQNMRVSVTRGKRRTTILTPNSDPCLLLLSNGSE